MQVDGAVEVQRARDPGELWELRGQEGVRYLGKRFALVVLFLLFIVLIGGLFMILSSVVRYLGKCFGLYSFSSCFVLSINRFVFVYATSLSLLVFYSFSSCCLFMFLFLTSVVHYLGKSFVLVVLLVLFFLVWIGLLLYSFSFSCS